MVFPTISQTPSFPMNPTSSSALQKRSSDTIAPVPTKRAKTGSNGLKRESGYDTDNSKSTLRGGKDLQGVQNDNEEGTSKRVSEDQADDEDAEMGGKGGEAGKGGKGSEGGKGGEGGEGSKAFDNVFGQVFLPKKKKQSKVSFIHFTVQRSIVDSLLNTGLG